MKWITEGFEGFSKGTMENGGQNLYVSRKGVLQRIFQYDINLDGYPDLTFACSQSMFERPPIYIYENLPKCDKFKKLTLAAGPYDGVMTDLNGDGYDDLVIACQHDGAHNDVTATIFYGSPKGITERSRIELYAPSSIGVCAGDFNGDGRKDLVFLSNNKLRTFYQVEQGFAPAEYIDYDVEAQSAAAADFDGDGFCDLAIKTKEGRVGIIYGTKDGLDAANICWLNEEAKEDGAEGGNSTAGMVEAAHTWKIEAPVVNGKQYLFICEDNKPVLYACGADRKFEAAMRFDCEGAVEIAAADFTGNGFDDVAFAVFKGREETADCKLYLGSGDGFCECRTVKFPVQGAVNVCPANLDGKALIVCRTGEEIVTEVDCPIFRFAADGTPTQIASVKAGESIRILAGRPAGGNGNDQIVSVNHMLNRKKGGEDVFVYLGGPDGYREDRRLELPGNSAVEGVLCDFFDKGVVDAMVVNCFEDNASADDGSYIYTNDGTGVDRNRKVSVPTVRGHGAAIGDFRHSGYLDIASGGFRNREIRIFHGSEKGYSLDNCTRIVLGGNAEGYEPPVYPKKGGLNLSEEESAMTTKYGEVRWDLAADLNGDGWLDLIVSEIVGPRCYILWGGPDGFSWENRTELLTDGVAYAAVADLDKDGYPDLILSSHMSTKKASKYEAYITIYWGGPDGISESRKQQLPIICGNSVTVGDFSGSGNLDLFATAYQNGRDRDIWARRYRNDNGSFSISDFQYLFNHSGSGCVAGDFNGDGYCDVAIAGHKEFGNHCSHSFIFWGGPDGLSDERKTILPATGPHGMSTVDPGNIMDRGPKEHYTSAAQKVDGTVKSITWEGVCTSTSWVEVEIRAAADEAALADAEWQTVENGADISALGLKGFVQYRLALCAKCACGTPRITKVTVDC